MIADGGIRRGEKWLELRGRPATEAVPPTLAPRLSRTSMRRLYFGYTSAGAKVDGRGGHG